MYSRLILRCMYTLGCEEGGYQMKTADIKIGAHYLTYIGQELSEVVVVAKIEGNPDSRWRDEKRTSFRVRRVGEDKPLPKKRSAAALRETGKDAYTSPQETSEDRETLGM